MDYSISTDGLGDEGNCFCKGVGDVGLLIVKNAFVSGDPDLPTKGWRDAIPQSFGKGFVFLGVGIVVPPILLKEGDLIGKFIYP